MFFFFFNHQRERLLRLMFQGQPARVLIELLTFIHPETAFYKKIKNKSPIINGLMGIHINAHVAEDYLV